MALNDAEKKQRRERLKQALLPARYNNVPLSKRGDDGTLLRDYLKSDTFKQGLQSGNGLFFVSKSPNLAASFARDYVLAGFSAQFYYLQTFASRAAEGFIDGMPKAFVIEWFEQENVVSPFAGREQHAIQTLMTEYMNDGVPFYMFTSVHPENSEWWSKAFIRAALECNTLIIGDTDDYRGRGERTSFGSTKTERQENSKTGKRVRVR